ncbi:MAG: hypothetical protein E7521_00290 [Ruminococcaceae bacterium]|nr:hypothetical protein [Oscillospiraceae bacterium]
MENEVIEIKPKNMYMQICITQAICIAVILISIVVMKFFFENDFKKVQKWCGENIFVHTQVTANFDEETTREN